MASTRLTRKRIDALQRFLPLLEGVGAASQTTWVRPTPKDGVNYFPCPQHTPAVDELYELAAQPWWCDFGYATKPIGKMVHDDAAIASATLAQIKSMLTWCVRGERFCDGHWGGMISDGRVTAILRRLKQLRDAMEDD